MVEYVIIRRRTNVGGFKLFVVSTIFNLNKQKHPAAREMERKFLLETILAVP
jgi:hypothetical protein